jgi:hypothetical protein
MDNERLFSLELPPQQFQFILRALAYLRPRGLGRDVLQQSPPEIALVAGALGEDEAERKNILGLELFFFLERFEKREGGVSIDVDKQLDGGLRPLRMRLELREGKQKFVLGLEFGEFFQRR